MISIAGGDPARFPLTNFSIDTSELIERVSALFCGHPNLIHGFSTFLASPQMITSRLQASSQSAEHDELNRARIYLDQIKLQFPEQPDIFYDFLDIMKDYQRSR